MSRRSLELIFSGFVVLSYTTSTRKMSSYLPRMFEVGSIPYFHKTMVFPYNVASSWNCIPRKPRTLNFVALVVEDGISGRFDRYSIRTHPS